jgi:AraC-like DNA-binding protein
MLEPRSASAGAGGGHHHGASRTMEDMLGAAHAQVGEAAGVQRTSDGWRSSLLSGVGFRHHYDADVARGGWDFYDLGQGLCLAVVDLVASVPMPRHHSYADYLIMTAVLEGDTHISAAPGAEGDFANGCCTVYGMEAGAAFETVYEPGRVLKWVSVFIDRRRLFGATGLQPQDLPARVSGFLLNGTQLPPQNVPLSRAASITAMQVLECRFQGGFRRAFLTSKALELACHLLHAITHDRRANEGGTFSNRDYERLQRAMALIESKLAEPPDIAELAGAVGLTRQKLQLGFRLVHGNSVARVRERVRLTRALALVRGSEMAMIDIAYEIGYEHPASFTRAFKAAYGVSPADMRRAVRDAALVCRPSTRT